MPTATRTVRPVTRPNRRQSPGQHPSVESHRKALKALRTITDELLAESDNWQEVRGWIAKDGMYRGQEREASPALFVPLYEVLKALSEAFAQAAREEIELAYEVGNSWQRIAEALGLKRAAEAHRLIRSKSTKSLQRFLNELDKMHTYYDRAYRDPPPYAREPIYKRAGRPKKPVPVRYKYLESEQAESAPATSGDRPSLFERYFPERQVLVRDAEPEADAQTDG